MADDKAVNEFDHKNFLARATTRPGVYDMRDQNGKTLYIGKARNLKNRLSSYFRTSGLTTKTMAMLNKVVNIELTVTHSETEALLLEQNLIKDRKPPYNILLRDDKSYPYIYLSTNDHFPRVDFHRGRKRKNGDYFGPFPSSGAVKESMQLLQKVFKVRQCPDSYFKNRARPCLQYQINRCKAPCVGLVDVDEYQRDVEDTRQFLNGRSQQLIRTLIKRMENEAKQHNFEQAAVIRDQISHLRVVQEQQSITKSVGNVDVIGFAELAGSICFDVLFIRSGRVLGHKYYIPDFQLEMTQQSYLAEFMAQFYVRLASSRNFPEEIVTPCALERPEILEEAISKIVGRQVKIKHRIRSERANWLSLANKNASQNLEAVLASKLHITQRIRQLEQLLSLEKISRIECFDISHTMGEATVGSCVVFGPDGPIKSEYRRFNITNIEPGDDYGAMRSALTRRYAALAQSPPREGCRPDIILIDGGKGQLSSANSVMSELALSIPLLGVAKGITRKPGLETLIYSGKELNTDGREAALLLIQQIRDEAHRFAITGHRQRRRVARNRSSLEDIPGIGSKRRSALLKFFSGRQGVINATVDELRKVEGISHKTAQQIHDFYHDS